MTRTRILFLASLALAGPALAAGPESFQHGGRATAQVGAFVARADDPAAVTYNPAGLASLPGLQILGGLDFRNPSDDFTGAGGTSRADHTIQFPPAAYVSWKPDDEAPYAFGFGIDTPYWHRIDFDPVAFPGRFTTRVQELRLWEVHAKAAYQLNETWSVGGGLRYLSGDLTRGFNVQTTLPPRGTDPAVFAELFADAEASVDALTFDLGVQFVTNTWGAGALYRHGAELEGTDDLDLTIRDITIPSQTDRVLATFPYDRATQDFELPAELRLGAWIAPYPELRLELDLAYQRWSALERSSFLALPNQTGLAPIDLTLRRDWDDTLSLRLGVEGELTDALTVSGGLAFEPSPVPDTTREPGFPRGDATVYAVGGSYDLDWLSFDLGYSFHDFGSTRARTNVNLPPAATGTFEATEQVWSFSARWRL
jgi:long-chain fatty acid transport protein